MSQMPRLLLLDGHSLAYRAFYALPVENFSTTTGQPTNAVYGFTSMLINTIKDEQPTHLAVAFDVSRQSFRTEEYPQYKANRDKSPDEFAGQVDLIREVLDAMGIPYVELAGYEADDIIATLAERAGESGFETLILSGDRDALQLVTNDVTVLYPRKGVSDLARMTPQAVLAKYKVTPEQYPDLAAIVGETSDNLPGVPGVGQGFASKWLNQYGTLDELVDHCDELTGKKGQSFRDHVSQVLTNRQLNGLVRDLELPVTVDDLARTPFDRQRIHEVFDSLQFRVLRERLFDYLDKDVAVSAESLEVVVEILEPGALSDWLADHAGQEVALSCDGRWGAGTGDLHGLGLAARDGAVAWLDLESLSTEDDAALGRWLADERAAKTLHEMKGNLLAFAARGYTVSGVSMDTALAAYLALPGQRSFDLRDLVARFLNRELQAEDSGDQLTLDTDSSGRAQEFGGLARAILDLGDHFRKLLEDRGVLPLLTSLEMPLAHVLAQMEITGICVDTASLEELEAGFGELVAQAEAEAHDLAGRPFNLGSPKQLQEVLFEERNLPKTRKIKTGYTTDADALQKLFLQTEDPLLKAILAWRDATKLRQTVAGLLPLADEHDRIHTTFNQTIATTGRLSSQDPNLQNIPVRTHEGRRIRDCFIPGPGYESLLTADYSQIEMRIMAHLSEDEGLIEAFRSGEDLHSTVAAKVFDVAPGDVDAEMRRRIKAMSYGLAYGLSAFGLSSQLDIPTDEAKRLMDDYFLRFGGIRDYLADVVARARQAGYTETMFGRRRFLPDLNHDNWQRRQMAERMALNAPIQGSAADIIKVAMIEVQRAMVDAGLRSRMLLQVHDELVFEVAPGEAEPLEAVVRTAMGSAAELAVPLDVSVGIGTSWNDAAH